MLSYKNLPYVNWVLNSLSHCKWKHILTCCRSKSKTKSMQLKVIMEMVICKLNKIYDRHLLHLTLTLQFPREICFHMKQQSQSQTDQFQSVLIFPSRYTFSSRCTKLKIVIVTPSACISVLHFNDIDLDPLLRTNIVYFTCKFYWLWWPTKQSASQRMAAMQEQHSNQLQYWTLTFSMVLMACRCKYVPFLRTQQPHLLFQMKSMNCPRKLLIWRLHLNPITLLFAFLWKPFVLFKIYHCHQKKFTFFEDCFWWHQEIFINLSKLCSPLKIAQEAML